MSSSPSNVAFLEHELPAQQSIENKNFRRSKPLRFITCGSVDDGKSTLIGRLLWDTKALMDDQRSALEHNTARQNELALPDFALLLDGLQAEREQGITIDVAYRYFSTENRAFIVADTPGHEQYTRNMATGASTADLAVILVDAKNGIMTQTRRHARIAYMMGIRQFILAVNKIDLADYDQQRFENIAEEFRTFASGLGMKSVTAIPLSGLKGENVVQPDVTAMPWYEGPTLVQALELATTRSAQKVGFRFPVQRVSRPNESFRGFQGAVAGGSVKPGDSVVALPSGEEANIKEIVTFDLVRNAAVAGDAITLVLDRNLDIARGDMIATADARPMVGKGFIADFVSFNREPISASKRYWLKAGSRRQRVRVHPRTRIDPNSNHLDEVEELGLNEIGAVQLDFEEEAIFDRYDDNRDTGSFILIDPDTNNTIGGGMITDPIANIEAIKTSQNGAVVLAFDPKTAMRLLGQLKSDEKVLMHIDIDQTELDQGKLEEIRDMVSQE